MYKTINNWLECFHVKWRFKISISQSMLESRPVTFICWCLTISENRLWIRRNTLKPIRTYNGSKLEGTIAYSEDSVQMVHQRWCCYWQPDLPNASSNVSLCHINRLCLHLHRKLSGPQINYLSYCQRFLKICNVSSEANMMYIRIMLKNGVIHCLGGISRWVLFMGIIWD